MNARPAAPGPGRKQRQLPEQRRDCAEDRQTLKPEGEEEKGAGERTRRSDRLAQRQHEHEHGEHRGDAKGQAAESLDRLPGPATSNAAAIR